MPWLPTFSQLSSQRPTDMLRLSIVLLVASIASACALGRVVVSFHLTMAVESRESAEVEWHSAPGSISVHRPRDWERNQYPYQSYEDNWLSLSLGGSQIGAVIEVQNKTQQLLCLRMDEAHISSNFAREPVRLKSVGPFWPKHYFFDLNEYEREKVKQDGPVTPPKFCLEPGRSMSQPLKVDLSTLFPSGYMFDVSWPQGGYTLTTKGVGNWFALEFPVESSGTRVHYKVTLTARDAKATPLRT